MYPPILTKDPTAVEMEAQAAYLGMFDNGDRLFVPRVFGWAIECFTGHYKDYQAVDAHYHDFEHTLQGTLCMARLLHARHQAGAQPVLTQRMFQLGLLAILLHDTGYLKKRGDKKGTGAKYTITHVERSAEFAEGLLTEKGFSHTDIKAVQNMIHCTGVDARLDEIPFQNEMEKIVGFALGTADHVLDRLDVGMAEPFLGQQSLGKLGAAFHVGDRVFGARALFVPAFLQVAGVMQQNSQQRSEEHTSE